MTSALLVWALSLPAQLDGGVLDTRAPTEPASAATQGVTSGAPALKVLLLASTGAAPDEVRAALDEALADELTALTMFDVVEPPPSDGGTPNSETCQQAACLKTLAGTAEANLVVRASTEARAETFAVSWSVFDARIQRTVARPRAQLQGPLGARRAIVFALGDLLLSTVSDDEATALEEAIQARVTALDAPVAEALQADGGPALATAEPKPPPTAVETTPLTPSKPKQDWRKVDGAKLLLARAEQVLGPQSGTKVYISAPKIDPAALEGTELEDAENDRSPLAIVGQAARDEQLSVITEADLEELLKQVTVITAVDEAKKPSDGELGTRLALGRRLGVSHRIDLALIDPAVEAQQAAETEKSGGGPSEEVSATDEKSWVVKAELLSVDNGEVVLERRIDLEAWEGSIPKALEVAARTVVAPLFAHEQGKLWVEVDDDDGELLIDGEEVAEMPLDEPLTVAGGTHVLTVRRGGFFSHRELIRIEDGGEAGRSFQLVPTPEHIMFHKVKVWTVYGLIGGSGATALTSLIGIGIGTGAWAYLAVIQASALDAEYADENGQINEFLMDGSRNPQFEEYTARRAALGTQAQLVSLIGWVSGAVFLTCAVVGVAALIFVDNPWRYDAFEEDAAEGGAFEEAAAEGGAFEEGAAEGGAVEEGAAEGGAVEEGAADRTAE